MNFIKRIILMSFLVFAATVFAHDVFLSAKPFVLDKPGSVTLSMYLAEAFPGEVIKWRADKTVRFWMIGPGTDVELTTKKETNPVIEFKNIGTYVIGWNATPSYIEVEPKLFNEYIEAEGYGNVIEIRKEQGKQDKPGREKYIRFLKCFVQVGSEKTNDYSKTLSQKIELIPLANPYSVSVGSELGVRVLFDGKPLRDTRVMATYDTFSKEHDVYAHTVQTNSEGIARIPINQSGTWMIRTNHMIPLEEDPKADWESYWTNFSFFVNPK